MDNETGPGMSGCARPRYPRSDDAAPGASTRRDGAHLAGARWDGSRWASGPRSSGPLRRAQQGRIAGGVAAGLAARTGINVTVVRAAFVIAALISGFGLAVYVLAWLFVPLAGDGSNIASRAVTDLGGIALAAVTASMLVVVLVILSILGVGWLSSFSWPILIAVVGLIFIWRDAQPDEQAMMRSLVEPMLGATQAKGRSWIRLRMSVACLLVVTGLITLVSVHAGRQALRPLGAVVLLVAATVVVLGPWWLRIARDLMVERQARVRAEERADIAARVHDSVLQTLALIQRRADNPQQVIQLARAQERELRSWLFDGRAPGSLDGLATTLAGGVRLIQQDVEAQHGIVVEVVTVGDCELDEDLCALLAAAREATINAAKWSGARVVSLFAEVEPAEASLFVKDRGKGFDPRAVPADRKGIAESVCARMARRGGLATVRSAPGEGTEVSLKMPRNAGQREPSRTQ